MVIRLEDLPSGSADDNNSKMSSSPDPVVGDEAPRGDFPSSADDGGAVRTRMDSEASYDGLEGMEPLGLEDLRSFARREQ